jgi:hypothetical protein
MPQDGKLQLGKEFFGDFAWKCETTSSTYDNRTTFMRGPHERQPRRSQKTTYSARYLDQAFRSERDSASVA